MIEFTKIMLSSIWGWVYLLIFLLMAWSVGKRGVKWYFIFLLASLVILGKVNPVGLSNASHALAAGPAAALQSYLLHTPWACSPGAALVFLGLAFGLLMLPVAAASIKFALQTSLVNSFSKHVYIGQSTFLRVLEDVTGGPLELLRSSIRVMAVSIFSLIMVICLWLALNRLGQAGNALSFPLLGLGDITLPHWKPVWQFTYFIAPVLIYLLNRRYTTQMEAIGIFTISRQASSAGHVIMMLALALVIPAGISLFLVGSALMTLPAVRLGMGFMASDLAEAAKWESITYGGEPPKPPDNLMVDPPPPPLNNWMSEPHMPPQQNTDPSPEYKPDLYGRMLFDVPEPRDMLVINHKRIAVLANNGGVYDWQGVQVTQTQVLHPNEALRIIPGSGEEILIIGKYGGEIRALDMTKGAEPRMIGTIGKDINCFCVNPFSTLMAYQVPGEKDLIGLFLGSGTKQILFQANREPDVIAFSLNGAELAIGYADGKIDILNMSTRQVVRTLFSPNLNTGAVLDVAPAPGGKWVAIYGNRCQACWDENGKLIHHIKSRQDVVCLAVNQDTGIVAMGSTNGTVAIISGDLTKVLLDERVDRERIIKLKFFNNVLFCAAHSGAIRRVDL